MYFRPLQSFLHIFLVKLHGIKIDQLLLRFILKIWIVCYISHMCIYQFTLMLLILFWYLLDLQIFYQHIVYVFMFFKFGFYG